MVLVQKEIKKVYLGDTQVRPPKEKLPPLCFTANTANSIVRLRKHNSPANVTLETSTDLNTRTTYTIDSSITLSNVGDKLYFRNTSETDTMFSTSTSNYYYFFLVSWSVSASGDVTTLLNKNGTDTLSDYCFYYLFQGCTSLTTPPEIPATVLASYCCSTMFTNCTSLTSVPEFPNINLAVGCYQHMFNSCTALSTLPKLPATTLANRCYQYMFYWCSNIKLSTTQTWAYQTEYRIPITWTWTTATDAVQYMFWNTWWTFTWTPTINTTYYTSNTVV